MNIVQISRKPAKGQFSLERLKKISSEEFENNAVLNLTLPYNSRGIINKLRNILFTMRLGKMDVVHVMGDIHYIIPFLRCKKIILTLLDFVALDQKYGIKRIMFKLFWFDFPLFFVSQIITLSKQVKEEVIKKYPKFLNKIHIIPSPLDPIFNSRTTHSRVDRRLLFIGIKENKNLYRSVEALNKLKLDDNLTLVLVAPFQPDCIKKLNDNILVELHDNLTDLDLLEEYDKAEILLFPSLSEGFGLPIVEAQSRGCLVITSNREPMRGVAGIGGAILVDPESVDSLALGLNQAISSKDPNILKDGYNNSKKYSAKFYINRHLRIYKQK